MSRIASQLKVAASIAVAVLIVTAGDGVLADPCVQNCRAQHNACRMATKLLSSPSCDAQLQACIGQCFAGARRAPPGEMREPRGPVDLRDLRGRR
jgi:hypothetical protein